MTAPRHDNGPLPLGELAASLSEGMEHLAALSLLVQDALSSCEFGRADAAEFRGLQNLDRITQSLEAYAGVLREIACLAPPDLALPAGPHAAALLHPPATETEAPEDGAVIWF